MDSPQIEVNHSPGRPSMSLNLNTIMIAVVMAVGGLVLNGTIEAGKKLSAIEAAQVTRVEVEEKNREIDVKIEGMRAESVSRTRDGDLRLESVRAEIAALRVEIARLDVSKQPKVTP